MTRTRPPNLSTIFSSLALNTKNLSNVMSLGLGIIKLNEPSLFFLIFIYPPFFINGQHTELGGHTKKERGKWHTAQIIFL